MKKVLLFGLGILFAGCASEHMATSVVELAGNQSVAGWKSSKEQQKIIVKKVVIKKEVAQKAAIEKDSDGDWVPDSLDKCPNTPQNMIVDRHGCPVFKKAEIIFDINSAFVKKHYYPVLKNIADVLKNNPLLKIKVSGFTDNTGDEKYNKLLSLKRANAVKKLLISFGANAKQIVTQGLGDKKPIVPNDTPTDLALNRRVEISAVN